MLGLLACACTANAVKAESQTDETGVLNLVLENDAFAHTDHHYTSGILLSYVRSKTGSPSGFKRFAHSLPEIDPDDDIFMGLHLGQQIFTPDNIHTEQLLPHERPYAGYLFGGLSLLAVNPRELDTWKFSIGVVGPRAYGQQFQTSIHKRIGANVARGWENQLTDETIFQFDYYKSWRQFWTYTSSRFEADLMPYTGFALGNAAVDADLGASLRFGRSLGNDFGPPRMRPSLPGSSYFDSRNGWGWYFFLGFGARYVAHNIFLDGNTGAASHSVDKYNWVGDLQAGWVFNTDHYRLAYTYVARSREYKSQKTGDEFGSLTLSLRF